jgi:hypothetical protein
MFCAALIYQFTQHLLTSFGGFVQNHVNKFVYIREESGINGVS